MIVVSDTSPILNLRFIDHLYLLRDIFGTIVVPPSVAEELARYGVELEASWMQVVGAEDRQLLSSLQMKLDPGEAEAIVVAMEIDADLIIVDERLGRRMAEEHHLEVVGVLGILARAKRNGLIPACKPLLDELIRDAGFWISTDLRTRYLQRIGEA